MFWVVRIVGLSQEKKTMKVAYSHQLSGPRPGNFFPWKPIEISNVFFHVAGEEQAREIVRGAQQRGRQMAEAQLQVPASERLWKTRRADSPVLCKLMLYTS